MLVNGLMDAGFQTVRLANPSAIKQYEGIVREALV
jgi:hypothetical protein